MNRIAKTETECKRVKVIRGGLGYVLRGQRERWHGVSLPKRSRGDIKGFSRSSQRRLRETLAMARSKSDSVVYGFCLTIPGKQLTPGEVRHIWHNFVAAYRKQYPLIPMVWRVELQAKSRRQAHWHTVAWLPKSSAAVTSVMIAELWRRVVRSRVGALSMRTDMGFDLYGVKVDCLSGASATGLIGYLCDHTSKHKQAQLGWKGRQWGVLNRSALDFEGVAVLEVDEREHIQAARQFRRLQEHLRRDGVYTGGGVTPSGNVQRSVFGKDAARLLKCYAAVKGGDRS